MRKHLVLFMSVSLSMILQAQQATDDDKVATLLSGRKNPGDQQVIASLGIGSLDSLLARLKSEHAQNKVPIYARLIGLKYRQFSENLTPAKQTEIITLICSKIKAIKDEGQTAYLIQSSLEHLHGIDHPAVLQLTEEYSKSDVEWTRKAAQSLKATLSGSEVEQAGPISAPRATPTPQPPPVVRPPTPEAPEAKPTPTTPSVETASSTPWSIIVVLIVAALGLLWLLLKRRS